MKRSSTATVFVLSAATWIVAAPLIVLGVAAGMVVWPFVRGFMLIWESLED